MEERLVRPRYRIHRTVAEEEDQWRIEAMRDRLDAETFLISNDARRAARQLLESYKTPWVAERGQALVKGPLVIVPLFLKDPLKITAYVYVAY